MSPLAPIDKARFSRSRRLPAAHIVLIALAVAGLVAAGAGRSAASSPSADTRVASARTALHRVSETRVTSRYRKVLIIVEENETEASVVGSAAAPYISSLAKAYGWVRRMDAGYPVSCPSLAAYIILTSGSRHGICNDDPASRLRIAGPSIFSQLTSTHRSWRQFSESMKTNCQLSNGSGGLYLVRHAPAAYYVSAATACHRWDVPLGTTAKGALHNALTSGLPSYSIVTPNACHDMHGASSCRSGLVKRGDGWLRMWLPRILASKDYRAHRLAVILTWDEGSRRSNHIPTLIISPTTHKVRSTLAFTHCSTLRTAEEAVGLPLLGCAKRARSFRAVFHL